MSQNHGLYHLDFLSDSNFQETHLQTLYKQRSYEQNPKDVPAKLL